MTLRYSLRTLLILLAVGPPLLGWLVLMSPLDRLALLQLVVVVGFFAVLSGLWIGWPTLTKWL